MTNRIAQFYKVSFEQFEKDFKEAGCQQIGFTTLRQLYDSIKLPKRATGGSAGYDFFCPMYMNINPNAYTTIPTGIKCKIDDGWFLSMTPKSGLSLKLETQYNPIIGIVDRDYFDNDGNEGHIMIHIKGKEHNFIPGDKYVQGIFIPYGITYNDNESSIRTGGYGSTGK